MAGSVDRIFCTRHNHPTEFEKSKNKRSDSRKTDHNSMNVSKLHQASQHVDNGNNYMTDKRIYGTFWREV